MILETPRLILRHWQEADAERLFELASDLLVGPAAGWEPHKSKEESLEIIRTVFNSDTIFAMILRETQEVIGCIGFAYDKDLCKDETESLLGYWVGTSYWNKGYMTEAAKRIVSYGFEDLRLNRLWCGNFIENTRSARIQEKCGFHLHHTETSSHWSEEEREIAITFLDKKVEK